MVVFLVPCLPFLNSEFYPSPRVIFLSLRVFGLLPSSLLLFPQHFGCCGNNNKDEDNSPKTLNDKNDQVLSQKFRQLLLVCFTEAKEASLP